MSSNPSLFVPPEMITELAMSMEPALTVAQRYGYDATAYADLSQQPHFKQAVKLKIEEVAEKGWTFHNKAATFAEELLFDLFREAKCLTSNIPVKLEVFKYFTKLASLEPKNTQPLDNGGSKFSIEIVIPEGRQPGIRVQAQLTPLAIEGEVSAPAEVAKPMINITPAAQDGGLPPPPKHITAGMPPGFDGLLGNRSLIAGVPENGQ